MSQMSPVVPGQPPAPPPRGWLARNWKLVLGLAAGVTALVIAAIGSLVFLVMSLFKNSDVEKQALARARSSPEVIQRLGGPIQAGWWRSGSINTSGDFGEAKLTIPISGPKGTGKLYLMAEKRAGTWSFSFLQIVVDATGEKIDLLAEPSNVRSPAHGEPWTARVLPAGVRGRSADAHAHSADSSPTGIVEAAEVEIVVQNAEGDDREGKDLGALVQVPAKGLLVIGYGDVRVDSPIQHIAVHRD